MAVDSKPGNAGCYAAVVIAIAFTSVIFLRMCFTKVPANTIGVRTFTNGGIEQKDHDPGYVLTIPGLHSVRLWDPTWSNEYQHMEVRGSDQYKTTVDVSVIFRIHQGRCYEVAGKFPDYKRIRSAVASSLSHFANQILTQMKTEDFYNSNMRDEKTKEMQRLMDKQLEDMGLEVKSVLLRNIEYDETFERQLLAKQLAGQTRDLEDALTKQTIGETETELIGKQADAEVLGIRESLAQETANLKAEADQKFNQILQLAQLNAEAITAKAKAGKRAKMAKAEAVKAEATAYGTAALSRVYAKPGANYYFAQKALQGIKLGNIELNSSAFNPLETEKLLKALGLDIGIPQTQTPPTKK